VLDNCKPDDGTGRHDGVANFGIRPMYQTQVPLMEAHLFDFDGDLYGKHLMVELIAYIRPEAKFEGLPALVAEIGRDAGKAREILGKTGAPPPLDA
jgi:riboflavin kinase/FMN adenylyltransferase